MFGGDFHKYIGLCQLGSDSRAEACYLPVAAWGLARKGASCELCCWPEHEGAQTHQCPWKRRLCGAVGDACARSAGLAARDELRQCEVVSIVLFLSFIAAFPYHLLASGGSSWIWGGRSVSPRSCSLSCRQGWGLRCEG